MLNQIVLVGRIKEIKEDKKNKCGIMTLAVQQNFKNTNGEYDINFIDIKMFGGIAENTKEYCKNGDMVGVKGRLQSETINLFNGKFISNVCNVIAERVTFLSNKATRKEDEE